MLRSVRITGFRGLRDLSLHGLARVNLLVGRNNCGKTSVLEALSILGRAGSLMALAEAQVRRSEHFDVSPVEFDLAQILGDRRLERGAGFEVHAETATGARALSVQIVARDSAEPEPDLALVMGGSAQSVLAPLAVDFRWTPQGGFVVPLSLRGGLRERDVATVHLVPVEGDRSPPLLVPAGGLQLSAILATFEPNSTPGSPGRTRPAGKPTSRSTGTRRHRPLRPPRPSLPGSVACSAYRAPPGHYPAASATPS
jgi:hypothetical protein